eukprot:3939288-Rhodomonas_salina.4
MPDLCELVAHAVAYVEEAEADAALSKSDLADGVRMRLCVLLGRLVAHPASTSFALPCAPCAAGDAESARVLQEFYGT